MADEETVLQIVRMLAGGGKKISELASATDLPRWKVARLLKRLEKLGFLRSEDEVKFSPGRPAKIYSLTREGIGFFSKRGLRLVEARRDLASGNSG